MVALDPRTNAFRPEIAAKHLQGQVEAARFVEGTRHRVNEPVAAMRRAPSHEARLDTQALLGETVTVYETNEEGWAWGQLEADGYVGWLSANALAPSGAAPTHKVAVPRTLVFPGPDIKLPPVTALPMGARLTIARQDERFAVDAAGWHVPSVHLAPLKARQPDFVAVAERFLNAPYLWGGKTSLGLDCSGLVQVALQAAGVSCPRDSDMQELALGTVSSLAQLRRGDLMFWKGHVAVARDPETLIHANAHHMMVASEPVADAVARIKAAGGEVTSVKRLVSSS
ncbi:MAG: C40 family peptidase [Rhizobiales bacterium]|nr:C40 family peptidase [Hyphomicrobiales bacterium]